MRCKKVTWSRSHQIPRLTPCRASVALPEGNCSCLNEPLPAPTPFPVSMTRVVLAMAVSSVVFVVAPPAISPLLRASAQGGLVNGQYLTRADTTPVGDLIHTVEPLGSLSADVGKSGDLRLSFRGFVEGLIRTVTDADSDEDLSRFVNRDGSILISHPSRLHPTEWTELGLGMQSYVSLFPNSEAGVPLTGPARYEIAIVSYVNALSLEPLQWNRARFHHEAWSWWRGGASSSVVTNEHPVTIGGGEYWLSLEHHGESVIHRATRHDGTNVLEFIVYSSHDSGAQTAARSELHQLLTSVSWAAPDTGSVAARPTPEW